jgi:hypothetical protein
MGVIRKALVISTGGLAGLVFKESPGAQDTAKAAARPARPRGSRSVKQGAKATRRPAAKAARPVAARAVRGPAAKARRPAAAKAARASAAKVEPAPVTAMAPVAASAQAPVAGGGTIDGLERLADLHARGALTGAEFAAAKAKILGTAAPPPASESEPAAFPAIEANVAAARHLADLGGYRPNPSLASSGD